MAEHARRGTVRLQRMVRAYRVSGALMAAVELGVFSRIAEGADTEAALNAALGNVPLDVERGGPADAAMWKLARTAQAGTGLAHSVSEVEGYFAAAGFGDVRTVDFVPDVPTRTGGRKKRQGRRPK